MSDLDILKRLSKEFNVKLNEVESYYWSEGGYGLNADGRVEMLNLRASKIGKLPEYIQELSELKKLYVVGHGITSINEIQELKKLETLKLDVNKIEDISVVSQFKLLRELYLGHNPIVDLSPIQGLEHLRLLTIQYTLIRECSLITTLPSLTTLTLSDRELGNAKFLPRCRRLTELNIWTMDPDPTLPEATLPEGIYDILERINLTHLGITSFSDVNLNRIANLTQLKSLTLRLCAFNNIYPLAGMKQLSKLDISNNDIEDILCLSGFHLLEELDISDTGVENIQSLKELKQLKSLDLSETQVSDLRPLLGLDMRFANRRNELDSGKGILIYGCSITNPPIEVARQGNDAIRRYFEKIEAEGLDYIFEAKLILVGEGGSGKTSLQKRLLDEKAVLPEGNNRTRGIEVVDYEFARDKKGAIKTVHIWDFGGQDVYYPVHRFFITENSVFVLLASTRQPLHNFDYWIPTIFQFGGKSPVIIGQTCHQGNTASWNELDMYLGNPTYNIITKQDPSFYRLDLPNKNLGLKPIKSAIINQIENLPHFGKGVPKSWLIVRKALTKESGLKACIPFQSFIELCEQVAKDSFKDLQSVEDCCRFLHDIGVILWYSQVDELKEWVILQPDWAMNAVYKIIDDQEIQERNGLIRKTDFDRLWSSKEYESKHSILKKMLNSFKIAFPTKASLGEYILPARLTPIPGEKKWVLEEKCLRLEYSFEFMPRGIVNQLSADLSRYISGYDVWNNAVNLAYNNGDTQSQIIEDSYNRKLSIISKGTDARGINILIMNSIRNIIDSYKGVKEKIYVKCPCKSCEKLEQPTVFLYEKLLEWSLKRPTGTVTCNESGEALRISDLLYDAGFVGTRIEQPHTEPKQKIITIFLASSEELKEHREKFEIFINRENKELAPDGIFLRLEIWEDFIDCMSKDGLQNKYNKAIEQGDIFVSLFWIRVGKYTTEEFEHAWESFTNKGRPYIYTYFNDKHVNPNSIKKEDFDAKIKFQSRLSELKHYPSYYQNIDDLKLQFKIQLQKILPSLC